MKNKSNSFHYFSHDMMVKLFL